MNAKPGITLGMVDMNVGSSNKGVREYDGRLK